VILLDADLLVYATASSLAQHERARAWLDARLNGTAPVGLAWPSLPAFLRLVSNPRVFERPRPIGEAWAQVEAWLARPPAWIPQPTEQHREILGGFVRGAVSRPALIADAHLAALAIEHGLIVCSTDGDFARFPGLRWENPLA
jgi:toxin-antitoxin system PIN domain toxin